MKRIIRERRVTPEEVAKYKRIREQVAHDLPDLIAQHRQREAQTMTQQEAIARLEAITRFWELLPPEIDAYSKWLQRCLEVLPEKTVSKFCEEMEMEYDSVEECEICGNEFDDNPGKTVCKRCEKWRDSEVPII
jgi:hypothetical protein